MITAVDTNVLLDVLEGDANQGRRSQEALRACQREGRLVVCEIVLAELSRYYKALPQLQAALATMGLGAEALGEPACHAAGQAFLKYRRRGGTRDRILADFLIGAHAEIRCSRLLTRDRGFYRDYFPELVIVDPSV